MKNGPRVGLDRRRFTMRLQPLLLLCVLGSWLPWPTGYAGDLLASSPEHPSTSQVVEAQRDTDQPAVVHVAPAPAVESPATATTELGDIAPPEETGEVQERAVILDPRTQRGAFTPLQPAPPPIAQPDPKQLPADAAPAPSGMAPLPGATAPAPSGKAPPTVRVPLHVAPTEDLTKVANAIQIRTKSLTTVVKIPPGLALTGSAPVKIRIDYSSLGYLGTVWEPRAMGPGGFPLSFPPDYSSAKGNVIYIWDREGNGAPRPVTLTITLTQGQFKYTYFGVPMTVTLTPLYEALVSGLTFYIDAHCDLVGNNEIHLGWWSPDGTWREPPSFGLVSGKWRSFTEFSFAAREQSHSAIQQFHMPAIGFWENDPGSSVKSPFVKPSLVPLFAPPAKPGYPNESFSVHLRDIAGDSGCTGTAKFQVWRRLMEFKDLP